MGTRLVFYLVPLSLLAQSPPEVGALHVRVLTGEGAVHAPGATSRDSLAVEVSDEAGRLVQGAAVSFRLPQAGPGGLFANGLPTEIVITGPDGRAAVSRMRWNRTPGSFQIRVTAAKGPLRAALLVHQSIAGGRSDAAPGTPAAAGPQPPLAGTPGTIVLPPYKPRRRWLTPTLVTAAVAAGAVGAGLAFGRRAASAAGGASQPPLSVGPPAITIEAPK